MRIAIALALVAASACGGSSTSSPSAPELRATMTDPSGDAAQVIAAAAPDLTGATVLVSNGSVTVTAMFAPGTLVQGQTMVAAYVDTDENPSTGNPGMPGVAGAPDNGLIGWDFLIRAGGTRNSPAANVAAATGVVTGPGQNAQTAAPHFNTTATFPSADHMQVVVPLSALGNDDGRMTVKIVAYQWTDTGAAPTDYLPNLGFPPVAVR